MNLVEKVAQSIMLSRENGGCEVKDWGVEERDNPHVEQAIRQARAAIAVVHEHLKTVTEPMSDAGGTIIANLDLHFGKPEKHHVRVAGNVWNEMLEAAFEEVE